MFGNEDYYLRPIQEDDLQWLADLRNNEQTWPYLGTLNFTNLPKQKSWLEKSSLDAKQMNFIFCKHPVGQLVGFVRLDELDTVNGNVRVGGDIHPDYRGLGLSKEMYKQIFRLAFDYLRLHRVWLLVAAYNEKAITLYKKIGMREEGCYREALFRNGQYHDYLIFSILQNERAYGSTTANTNS